MPFAPAEKDSAQSLMIAIINGYPISRVRVLRLNFHFIAPIWNVFCGGRRHFSDTICFQEMLKSRLLAWKKNREMVKLLEKTISVIFCEHPEMLKSTVNLDCDARSWDVQISPPLNTLLKEFVKAESDSSAFCMEPLMQRDSRNGLFRPHLTVAAFLV